MKSVWQLSYFEGEILVLSLGILCVFGILLYSAWNRFEGEKTMGDPNGSERRNYRREMWAISEDDPEFYGKIRSIFEAYIGETKGIAFATHETASEKTKRIREAAISRILMRLRDVEYARCV